MSPFHDYARGSGGATSPKSPIQPTNDGRWRSHELFQPERLPDRPKPGEVRSWSACEHLQPRGGSGQLGCTRSDARAVADRLADGGAAPYGSAGRDPVGFHRLAGVLGAVRVRLPSRRDWANPLARPAHQLLLPRSMEHRQGLAHQRAGRDGRGGVSVRDRVDATADRDGEPEFRPAPTSLGRLPRGQTDSWKIRTIRCTSCCRTGFPRTSTRFPPGATGGRGSTTTPTGPVSVRPRPMCSTVIRDATSSTRAATAAEPTRTRTANTGGAIVTIRRRSPASRVRPRSSAPTSCICGSDIGA
jgi:hypothetical protein